MARVQGRIKKKIGTSPKMQRKHVVEAKVDTSPEAKMTGLAKEVTAGDVKEDTVEELQDPEAPQGMLQLCFEVLKVIVITNIFVALTNSIRIRIEAKALLLPLPLRLLYHLIFQVIPVLSITVYTVCSLGPGFKKEWNRKEEPRCLPVNKCAEVKIDISPETNKGLVEDKTAGSVDSSTETTPAEAKSEIPLPIAVAIALMLTALVKIVHFWHESSVANSPAGQHSIIPAILQMILAVVTVSLCVNVFGYGPDYKKWWAGLERFWCSIFNALRAEKETIDPVGETSRGKIVRILHYQSINCIIQTLAVIYVMFVCDNIFGGDLTMLAALRKVHPIVFWFKMLPALYHLYAVASILILCIKKSLAFDVKFPFPEDKVLYRNFRRKIELSENIWYNAYVQACLWLFVRPDSLDTEKHCNEDEKLTAFTKHISRVVWNAERGVRWKLLYFIWSAPLLLFVFLIDIKLTIITLFSNKSVFVLVNGIKTELEERRLFGYWTAVFILKVSAWLLSFYVTVLPATFLGIWLGSLKLARIINRDIQGMKKKFGDEAGLEMARMWRSQFREMHPWVKWASGAYWWLNTSATMLSDNLKAGIEKVINPFFPADEKIAAEA